MLMSWVRCVALFTWWQREDILKSSSDREDIVRLMSPHFIPPLLFHFPPAWLLGWFCSCFPASSSLNKMTHLSHSLLLLFFFYIHFCTYKWDVGQMQAFHLPEFDMEIHLPQQSKTIQLYYLTVKHAAASSPAGGNEVFLHCWGG